MTLSHHHLPETLCHMVQNQIAQRPDAAAFIYKEDSTWRTLTWLQVSGQVNRLVQALDHLQFKAGTRIAIIAKNSPQWVIADLAILHLGGVVVGIFPTMTGEQVQYILKDCAAEAVFVDDLTQLEKILGQAKHLPQLKAIVHFCNHDAPAPPPPGVNLFSLAKLMQMGEAGEKNPQNFWKQVQPQTLAALIYTSGTTGVPKGVMLSHGNCVSNIVALREWMTTHEKNPLSFSFLPLCHVFERIAGCYFHLLLGIPMAFAESLDTLAANMQEVKPTRFCAVPRIFEKMHAKIMENVEKSSAVKQKLFYWALDVGKKYQSFKHRHEQVPFAILLQKKCAAVLVHRKIQRLLGGRLVMAISGGGPLNPTLGEFFDAMGIPVLQAFGLTEATLAVSVSTLHNYRYDTCGVPLLGVEVKLADDAEVWVRSRGVMQGYYRDEQATRAVLTDDGWLKTGDVGVLDPDGHLRIVDRKKDIIVTAGGKNVAPQMIETQLKRALYITDVCVIGDTRPYLTCLIVPNYEKLRAYAIDKQIPFTHSADLIEKSEIKDLLQISVDGVNANLAPYERIKKFSLLPQEFSAEQGEVTPTLKVRRKIIAERYASLITAFYA